VVSLDCLTDCTGRRACESGRASDVEDKLAGSCVDVVEEVLASSSPTSWVIPAYSISWDMAAVERLETAEVVVVAEMRGGGVVPRVAASSSAGVMSEGRDDNKNMGSHQINLSQHGAILEWPRIP
jgi:hypothetical protein